MKKPLLNWRPSPSSESHKRLSTYISIVFLTVIVWLDITPTMTIISSYQIEELIILLIRNVQCLLEQESKIILIWVNLNFYLFTQNFSYMSLIVQTKDMHVILYNNVFGFNLCIVLMGNFMKSLYLTTINNRLSWLIVELSSKP